jgi:hypothetical protein
MLLPDDKIYPSENSMNKQKLQTLSFLLVTFLISIAGWIALFNMMVERNFIQASLKWQVLLAADSLLIILQAVLILLYWLPATHKKASHILEKVQSIQLSPIIVGGILILLSGIYTLLVYSAFGEFFEGLILRVFLLWFIAVMGALCIGRQGKFNFLVRMAFVFSLCSLFFVLYSFRKSISASPFTLSWSEASRYYYASLFDSTKLYGQRLAWPFLHPSRYLLQSIPFFVVDFPIIVHRIWQVVLWISMPLITIGVYLRRIVPMKGIKAWMFVVWSFLFLYQGPVYFHLLVCVWVVFLGYDKNKPWKTTLFVILASLWAGFSRVNWFPVPAMIAITLYLLDTPFPGKQKLLSYFTWPSLFAILGLVSALGSQVGYAFLSGEEKIESFGSSFSSDLLWYRLFPNATSQMGIIIPILFLTLPILVFLAIQFSRSKFHFWQLLPIAGINFVLFAGGLVVSTKIGGGGNLHNLDAWLVMLWLIAGKMISLPDDQPNPSKVIRKPPVWLWVSLILLPAIYHIDINRSYQNILGGKVDFQVGSEEVQLIRTIAETAHNAGKEVLFVSQRQLLMFEDINVPLVSEYELLTLMEMAISNNEPYLQAFRQDLQNHRFGIIVIEKQVPKITSTEDAYFSEENNAWVKNITFPLLEYYTETHAYPVSGVTILEPKD